MAYFVLSPNGEESIKNKFSSPDPDPDPDHLRGGPSDGYTTSCVKKSSQSHLRGGPSEGYTTSCVNKSSQSEQ